MAQTGCYFPFKVDNPHYGTDENQPPKLPANCGKCPYCLQRRASNWVFRCIQELKVSRTAYFITLTYEHPPITKNGFMTLCKKDFQNFMKRLRKLYPLPDPNDRTTQIKYYAVGEYGTRTQRPHYHAILFNADADKVVQAWKGTYGETVNGLTDFKPVNENTTQYTAKYINKIGKIPLFEADDRVPEFQLFSKGLGINYLTEATIAFHQADPKRLYVTQSGFKKALPRYFKDKIFTDEDVKKKQAQLAQARANTVYDEQYKQYKKAKGKGQTFEEFRYARKKNALDNFRKNAQKRDNI